MKIPPVTVSGKSLMNVKEALETYLEANCVNAIQHDEQNAYITFHSTEETILITTFVERIAYGINITHNNNIYHISTQYLDI